MGSGASRIQTLRFSWSISFASGSADSSSAAPSVVFDAVSVLANAVQRSLSS